LSWKTDTNHRFRINPDLVKNYFDKKQKLMFSRDSATREEIALLKYIILNKGSKVLDLGCGNGRWAFLLKDNIKKYVGVDFSSNFIEKARKKIKESHVEFICTPAEEYMSEEKFDLILVIGLLTYLNDEQIIKLSDNIRKMMTKGGRLIVRNVTLGEGNIKRKFFNRETHFIKKLFGRYGYQVIRRSIHEELNFFKNFRLIHKGFIENTGYVFYVFE